MVQVFLSLQRSVSLPSQNTMVNLSLSALRNWNPSSRWIKCSMATSCFSCPAFMDLLFPLHFLSAICDFPKRIFSWSFFVLKNMFATHMAAPLSDHFNSDLQMSLSWTPTSLSLSSDLFWPRNIPGYAISSEYWSLNILSANCFPLLVQHLKYVDSHCAQQNVSLSTWCQ